MIGLREAAAPYVLWIKVGALALVILVSFRAGCSVQASRDGALIEQKNAALKSAATALRGSSSALREINAEAARQIAAAKAQAASADDARKVAQAAKDKAEKETERLDEELERAKKRRPGCAELLKQSLEASCGLSPR